MLEELVLGRSEYYLFSMWHFIDGVKIVRFFLNVNKSYFLIINNRCLYLFSIPLYYFLLFILNNNYIRRKIDLFIMIISTDIITIIIC